MAGQSPPPGEGAFTQFGQTFPNRADAGVHEIGQDRAGLGESRYVVDSDGRARLDHSQPREAPPPAEEATEASQTKDGQLDPPSRSHAPDLPTRPDALTQTPAGPSVWEAREPGEGD